MFSNFGKKIIGEQLAILLKVGAHVIGKMGSLILNFAYDLHWLMMRKT
jgi:hypothetical protein